MGRISDDFQRLRDDIVSSRRERQATLQQVSQERQALSAETRRFMEQKRLERLERHGKVMAQIKTGHADAGQIERQRKKEVSLQLAAARDELTRRAERGRQSRASFIRATQGGINALLSESNRKRQEHARRSQQERIENRRRVAREMAEIHQGDQARRAEVQELRLEVQAQLEQNRANRAEQARRGQASRQAHLQEMQSQVSSLMRGIQIGRQETQRDLQEMRRFWHGEAGASAAPVAEKPAPPAHKPKPPPRKQAPPAAAKNTPGQDDLTLLPNIGPAREQHLILMGITNYDQVATFSGEELAALFDDAKITAAACQKTVDEARTRCAERES